ncbi:MAG TPA: tetratricopeptide repeat protein, partial [Cyclobacteriaceae bacterium]|nr:tetratricopeptide repeat protein [Cyclobacteriaceae bacterium]
MRRIFLIPVFVLNCLCGNSQDIFKRIDSLISAPDYAAAENAITGFSTNDPATRYLLQNRLAEIQITQGKLDQAESTLNILTSANSDGFLKAITKTNLGFLHLNKARNDLALKNLQEALNEFQSSNKGNSLDAAKCLTYLSSLYLSTGKLNQAEDYGLQALSIRQNLKGENSEEVAASYNDLGLVYSQTDPDKALDYYEKALAVYQKLHAADHPKIAIANTNIGFLYRQLQLYGDAVNNFESAEATWKKIYPNGHPNQALALVNLGLTYKEMGNIKAATGYYERAIEIYKKAYGEKHPSLSYVYNQVAVIKLGENDYDAA